MAGNALHSKGNNTLETLKLLKWFYKNVINKYTEISIWTSILVL